MVQYKFCPQCSRSLVLDSEKRPSCPDGHFIKYPTPVASTLAFIENDGEYLTIKRAQEPKKGYWDLPGGFCEYDEDGTKTILREIQEETKLANIEIVKIIGAFPSNYGGIEKVISIAYLMKSADRNVIISDENTEYKWAKLNEMPELAFEDCQLALATLKQLNS